MKKIKFYLPLLAVLWIGAAIQSIGEGIGSLGLESADALQKEGSAILCEKERPGRMSQSQMEEEAMAMLSAYGGKKAGEVSEDNFYSFYGFSSAIGQYVVSGEEKINLNLVITYDEQKDMTYIIWATPFLNNDF